MGVEWPGHPGLGSLLSCCRSSCSGSSLFACFFCLSPALTDSQLLLFHSSCLSGGSSPARRRYDGQRTLPSFPVGGCLFLCSLPACQGIVNKLDRHLHKRNTSSGAGRPYAHHMHSVFHLSQSCLSCRYIAGVKVRPRTPTGSFLLCQVRSVFSFTCCLMLCLLSRLLIRVCTSGRLCSWSPMRGRSRQNIPPAVAETLPCTVSDQDWLPYPGIILKVNGWNQLKSAPGRCSTAIEQKAQLAKS